MDKIEKQVVGYVYVPWSHYFCEECAYISEDGRCTNYVPEDEKVARYGGCNDWKDLEHGRLEGLHDRTKEQTGYVENRAGYSCKRCEEFIPAERDCKKVDKDSVGLTPSEINPNACCNRWEHDPQRGDMSDSELIQIITAPTKGEQLTTLFRRTVPGKN